MADAPVPERLPVYLVQPVHGSVPPVPPPLGAVRPEKSRRLGEPVPGLVTLLGVLLLMMAAVTVAGVADGLPCRYSAATPTTCGVAMLVPLMVLVAVVLLYHVLRMLEPGAKMSTQVP